MVDEKDVAGSMAIINFANDIESLTNSYAAYLNVRVMIKDKYGENIKAVDEGDRDALIQTADTVRSYMVRCWADAEKLSPQLPAVNKKLKDIRKIYSDAKQTSLLDMEQIESYIITLSSAFTESVLAGLLTRAQDIYKEVLA